MIKSLLFFYKLKAKVQVRLKKLADRMCSGKRGNNSPCFSHVTYYICGNAGDTVLSECVRRIFDSELKVGSWNKITVSDKVNKKLINRINETKALVIGGGGLFLPDTNRNSISGWQWAISKEDLERIEVPIIIFSVGYNYFRGQKPGKLFVDNLNAIVEKSGFVGLRNGGSVRNVKQLLSPELKEKVVYQPCITTMIRIIYPDIPPKKTTGKVAFNFAFDRADKRFADKQKTIISEIVKSVYQIKNKGYEIYIVAHCAADLTVLTEMQDTKDIHIVNASCWSYDKLILFYNEIDVVLGMRGHAQMIPFGLNCHIISLGSHDKMRWFLEDIDATDWYIELSEDIENLSERITKKFMEIHEEKAEETNMRLLKAQQKLWEITSRNMDQIRQLTEKFGGGYIKN